MNFGTNLRNLRVGRKLTQSELARDLGVSQAAVGSWEVGYRVPEFRMVQRIATYFGVPMSFLMPEEFPTQENNTEIINQMLHKNKTLYALFDKMKYMDDSDLLAILGVVNAIYEKLENKNNE